MIFDNFIQEQIRQFITKISLLLIKVEKHFFIIGIIVISGRAHIRISFYEHFIDIIWWLLLDLSWTFVVIFFKKWLHFFKQRRIRYFIPILQAFRDKIAINTYVIELSMQIIVMWVCLLLQLYLNKPMFIIFIRFL